MNVKDYFKKRILRKIAPSIEKAKSSLKIAELKLNEAQKLFLAGFYNNSVLSSYTSMFHAARAVLYKDGVQEKSHYATYLYINEKYSDKIPINLINSFNMLREERHEILYGFEEKISKKDAENSLTDAEDFIIEVKQIIENGKK